MKQKFELDLVLDQELSSDVIEDFLTAIDINAEQFTTLVVRNFGIDAWFKAFVESDQFNKLDSESKGEALDAFLGLKDFLTRFDDTCDKNNIYGYTRVTSEELLK